MENIKFKIILHKAFTWRIKVLFGFEPTVSELQPFKRKSTNIIMIIW